MSHKLILKVMTMTCSFFSLSILSSCSAPARYFDEVYGVSGENLTLGCVQKEIKKGMPQDEVILVLGSPNIVTKDQLGRETWVYDKIASEVRSSESSGLILYFSRGCDRVSRQEKTQRTLTVVVKFNADSCVEDVNYHASKF